MTRGERSAEGKFLKFGGRVERKRSVNSGGSFWRERGPGAGRGKERPGNSEKKNGPNCRKRVRRRRGAMKNGDKKEENLREKERRSDKKCGVRGMIKKNPA